MDAYDLSFDAPKITMNMGIYKEQIGFGEIASFLEFNIKADPLIGIKQEHEFDTKQLPYALKRFQVKAAIRGFIKFDAHVKLNMKTWEFTLTDNANNNSGGGGKCFQNGDVIQLEGGLGLELEGEGKYKREFRILWGWVPSAKTMIEAKVKLQTAGITRRFGVDKVRGPYFEDSLFNDGVDGEYYQKAELRIWKKGRG